MNEKVKSYVEWVYVGECLQYDGTNFEDFREWLGEESVLYSSYIVYENNKQLLIHDKYGINFVDIGDWVKKGENGVFVYSDNSFRYRCVEIKEPDYS